jgi:Protein of unknown function (DUF4257)
MIGLNDVKDWVYLVVAGAGCVGGFALDLIQAKGGLRMPGLFESTEDDKTRHYFDMGFLADMLIGGVAALAVFGIDHDTVKELWQLLAVSLVAGVAGGGLLLSFAKTLTAAEEKAVSALLETSLDDIANGDSGKGPGSGTAADLRKQAQGKLGSLKKLRNRLRWI